MILSDSATTESTRGKGKNKFLAIGAGVGIIFGYALGNAGVGLVIGAAIGYFIDRRRKAPDSTDDDQPRG